MWDGQEVDCWCDRFYSTTFKNCVLDGQEVDWWCDRSHSTIN
ncbi:hypothetical protein [Nostoc sp. GT001]|nr:hypothetical protein [Nostoc sp. GT001]MDM9580764.1 hypothetical protein [Nostoc sp. GT001]